MPEGHRGFAECAPCRVRRIGGLRRPEQLELEEVISLWRDTWARPMLKTDMSIIAAEPDPVNRARLSRSLVLLGQRVVSAGSAEEVLQLVREDMFQRAVVAIELSWAGEPIVKRLARLPSMRLVVATGPEGETEAETLARVSGADAYLARPVTIESLAEVIWTRAAERFG